MSEIENSVCFTATIDKIVPIEGADKIEKATVLGWSTIIGKNTFSEGETVLVLTQDAVIPEEFADHFNFKNYLRTKNGKFIVRTVKLRGVYSECILLSIEQVNKYLKGKYNSSPKPYQERLGITKYEEPVKIITVPGKGKIRMDKKNPNFLIYQKFPNVKNVPDMFKEGDRVVITRKLHGTNARFSLIKKHQYTFWEKIRKFLGLKVEDYVYIVGSHNVQKNGDTQGFYQEDYWSFISKKYDIEARLRATNSVLGSGIILFGEIIGHGIQKGYDYNLKEPEVKFFDITFSGTYACDPLFELFVSENLGLPIVEVLYRGPYSKDLKELKEFGFIEGTKVPHEGVVVKSTDGDRSRVAKFINPDYLIFNEKVGGTDFH